MPNLPDNKIFIPRCVALAAFFLFFAAAQAGQDSSPPIFSEAPPVVEPAKKTPPAPNPYLPDSKEDESAAVVVDLKKITPGSEDIPPLPAEPAPGRGARTFKALLELPESEFDIAEALLALGVERGFELSEPAAKTLQRLDDLAAKARQQLPASPDCSDYFDALYDIVLNRRPIEPAHEERAEDFDLSRAVFQHRGSCLSIGIAALAVAQRMHAPISGAQCPNHFFLRGSGIVKGREQPLNFDVTRPSPDNWSRLDDAFYRRWRRFDAKAEEGGEYLRPLSARQVVSAFLASRAGYLAREREVDAAFHDAERALALNPRNINALINAGYSKEAMRSLEEAETFYKQALELDPQCVRALNNLAFVKSRDKKSPVFDTRRAEKLIDQAIKIDPDQAYLYATRGEVFAAKGDYKEATRSMQTALNLAPKNTAYRERFMILREHLRSEAR